MIGLEEAEHSTRRVARALGWYASERLQVVSRYRLIDPPDGNGLYVFVELAPGKVVAVANSHLPSDPYGPYLVRDGGTAEELDALERSTRLPAIQQQLAVLPGLAARGISVFVPGDFNSPSHYDWTPAAAAARDDVPFAFDWPVSHPPTGRGRPRPLPRGAPRPPDAKRGPGSRGRPGGVESVPNEVHDRIDWVLVAGPARTLASEIVGERGGPDVDIGIAPYPTDHRGVVSTFAVRPGEAPVLVAPETRRLTIGQSLSVVFHAPGRRGERVTIVPRGGTEAVAEQATGSRDGTLTFGDVRAPARGLRGRPSSTGTTTCCRGRFWLYRPSEPTRVATSKLVYTKGKPIQVSWSNAPGMRWDWLALYRVTPGSLDAVRRRPAATPGTAATTATCSTSTRRPRSRARRRSPARRRRETVPGRSGPGCTRCGCSSTTATSPWPSRCASASSLAEHRLRCETIPACRRDERRRREHTREPRDTAGRTCRKRS